MASTLLVTLEIIERAAGAPGPRAESAPVVQLARLPFVHQADDALRQAGAVVGLHAGRDINRVAPTFGQHLPLPGRRTGRAGRRWRHALHDSGKKLRAEAEFHDDWHGLRRVRGSGQRQLDVHGNLRVGGIVHVPDELLRDYRDIFVHLPGCADHFPIHLGGRFGRAAVNLAVKILHNLRAALLPPDFRRRDLLAVLQHQRVGRACVDVGLGLVIVRGIRRIGIAIGAAPDRRDVQQVHDPLVILLGRQLHRRSRFVRGCRCALLASAPRSVHAQHH